MIRLVATVCETVSLRGFCTGTGEKLGRTHLDRGKDDTSKGEQETEVGKCVLADGGQGGTEHDGDEGQVHEVLVCAVEDDAVDQHGEDGHGGAEDLVERHGDHGPVDRSRVG